MAHIGRKKHSLRTRQSIAEASPVSALRSTSFLPEVFLGALTPGSGDAALAKLPR
jgi:hypothetical protein